MAPADVTHLSSGEWGVSRFPDPAFSTCSHQLTLTISHGATELGARVSSDQFRCRGRKLSRHSAHSFSFNPQAISGSFYLRAFSCEGDSGCLVTSPWLIPEQSSGPAVGRGGWKGRYHCLEHHSPTTSSFLLCCYLPSCCSSRTRGRAHRFTTAIITSRLPPAPSG